MSRARIAVSISLVAALALAPGCGKKSDDHPAAARDTAGAAAPATERPTEPPTRRATPRSTEQSTEQSAASKPGSDWPGRPRRSVDGEVDGVHFTLQLPEGLQRAADTGKSLVRFEATSSDDVFAAPSIELRLRDHFPTSDKDGRAMIDPQGPPPSGPVILEDKLAGDRYYLLYRNPGSTFVYAYVLQRVGDRALECKGGQSRRTPIADADDLIWWFRVLCDGVAVQPPSSEKP